MLNSIKKFSLGKEYIGMSEYHFEALVALLDFNKSKLYLNDGLKGYTQKAERCLTSIFRHYIKTKDTPLQRPMTPQETIDEIAKMTDDQAIDEYARIFNIRPTL